MENNSKPNEKAIEGKSFDYKSSDSLYRVIINKYNEDTIQIKVNEYQTEKNIAYKERYTIDKLNRMNNWFSRVKSIEQLIQILNKYLEANHFSIEKNPDTNNLDFFINVVDIDMEEIEIVFNIPLDDNTYKINELINSLNELKIQVSCLQDKNFDLEYEALQYKDIENKTKKLDDKITNLENTLESMEKNLNNLRNEFEDYKKKKDNEISTIKENYSNIINNNNNIVTIKNNNSVVSESLQQNNIPLRSKPVNKTNTVLKVEEVANQDNTQENNQENNQDNSQNNSQKNSQNNSQDNSQDNIEEIIQDNSIKEEKQEEDLVVSKKSVQTSNLIQTPNTVQENDKPMSTPTPSEEPMNTKKEENTPKKLKSKKTSIPPVLSDVTCYCIRTHLFVIYIAITEQTILAYGTQNNSISFFYLLENKYLHSIENAHKGPILSIRHYLDNLKKRDLIITSSKDQTFKVWDITNNYENILVLTNGNFSSSLLSCNILFESETNTPYIITGDNSDCVKAFDLNCQNVKTFGNGQHPFDTEVYQEKGVDYIIEAGQFRVNSYTFKDGNVYHKYEKAKFFSSFCCKIFDFDGVIYLVNTENNGKCVSFWDFHKGEFLKSINIGESLTGFCIINDTILAAGCINKKIFLINYKENKIEQEIACGKSYVVTIDKINHLKYGECVIYSDYDGEMKLVPLNDEEL